MIIYGKRKTEIGAENMFAEKCPNCGTQNSVNMHIFQTYAHIFWIPMFPMLKTGVSQCNSCKQVLYKSEMPPQIKDAYNNLKSKSKTPWWTFIGVALLVLVIANYKIIRVQEKNEMAKLITEPKKGDIYTIHSIHGFYTLNKVDDVKGDTVYLI